jgi:hypothetical protein
MARHTLWLALLVAFSCTAIAQLHTITNVEYFFDADPGVGSATPLGIVPGDTAFFTGTISTSGLSPGVHVLHIRERRDDGMWGQPIRRMIRIGIGTTFEQAEVFFDDDPGAGHGAALAITADGEVSEAAFDVPDIGRGFHSFNVRCRTNATWSAPASRTLRLGSALIDAAELYFDTDPGEGFGVPVATGLGADVVALDSTVSVLSVGTGFHNAYLRFRGGGVWSFPKYQTMRIGAWVNGGSNRITGGEFFFDTDPGIGNGCPLIAEDGVFDEQNEAMRRYVLASTLTPGTHIVRLRVRDAGDRWHGPVSDTVTVSQAFLLDQPSVDSTGTKVRVSWSPYPTALLYRVHYDSVLTGAFSGYQTVLPPDTSLMLTTGAARRYFKLVAVQHDAEPCGSRSDDGQAATLPNHP